MRNAHTIVLLVSVLLFFITPSLNAYSLFYKASGGAVEVWYFPNAAYPTFIPIGYTSNPVYISNLTQKDYNSTFSIEFKPFVNGATSISKSFVVVYTFKPNSSQYTIPASVFKDAGEYVLLDNKTPGQGSHFFLISSSSVPSGLGSGVNDVTLLLGIGEIITLALIILLFVMLKRKYVL